jgi:hypothetical protein
MAPSGELAWTEFWTAAVLGRLVPPCTFQPVGTSIEKARSTGSVKVA